MYHHIITMPDYQDQTLSNLFETRDYNAIINYLSQWDNGDYSSIYDPVMTLDRGIGEKIYHADVTGSGSYAALIDWLHGSVTLYAWIEG